MRFKALCGDETEAEAEGEDDERPKRERLDADCESAPAREKGEGAAAWLAAPFAGVCGAGEDDEGEAG